MKPFSHVIACAALALGCQRGESTALQVSQQYRSDIANLCDAVVRSGADRLPIGERALAIATWLPANLTTREAHEYVVRIQPLIGEPKALALETEARRVGLSRCALAAEWRAAPP